MHIVSKYLFFLNNFHCMHFRIKRLASIFHHLKQMEITWQESG